ncbi:MAG TPA: tetratricopeptide repeat protein, partial [Gemmatimonadales bacterium]|nr:tetratricopeptide repeat protein [Gemmatimonadales bacterium]
MTLELLPLVAALALQSPAADTLRVLAQRLSESQLVLEARARPVEARAAISEALARSVAGPPNSAEDLTVARRLAAAYALAWRDSFPLREVARFAAWPRERRAAKLGADSVRRVGVAAFGRDGPAAAIAIWRRALVRATAIDDSAGIAAVLGNIGAGMVEESRLDSAAAYLERARRLAVAIGDLRVEGNAVGTLARVSAERGDLAVARERYARALALAERIGDSRGLAATHNQLGLLAQQLGGLEEAHREFDSAMAINRRAGRDDGAATNL